MHTNCPTAQHNPNPDIIHFNTERWCSSYCAIKHLHQSWIFYDLLLQLWTHAECTDGWPDNKVIGHCWCLIRMWTYPCACHLWALIACMNDLADILALHSLLMHSILAWVAYYGNDYPMQQAYSFLVQSERSSMRSLYRHYADFYIS